MTEPNGPNEPKGRGMGRRAGPRRRAEDSVLGLRGLTVERGRRAVVRDVSIEIPAGKVTALLGPNGAGKSSLVLAVGGVLRLQAGSVLLDGLEWANRRPERIRRAGIAIVPEGRRLLSDLTVEDNIRVATYALSADQARAGRDRALELFPEISRRLSAPARMLSGGEQQMVVLAQALVSQPRYMLIDELSLGLAPVVVNRLIPAIRAVAESGIGVLLIEQFATVALGLANHAHIMEGGQLRFSGLARELREKPELLRSAYLLRGSNDAPGRNARSSAPSRNARSSAPSRHLPSGNSPVAPADRAPHDPAAPPQDPGAPPGDSPAAGRPTRGTS
jgi:branched-chain amino acid transport system ATP-binding protein